MPQLLKGADFYIMGARGLSPTPEEQVHGSECVLQSMPCREGPWLPPLLRDMVRSDEGGQVAPLVSTLVLTLRTV